MTIFSASASKCPRYTSRPKGYRPGGDLLPSTQLPPPFSEAAVGSHKSAVDPFLLNEQIEKLLVDSPPVLLRTMSAQQHFVLDPDKPDEGWMVSWSADGVGKGHMVPYTV